MARRAISVSKSGVATGTALKTVLQVKAVSAFLLVAEFGISFNGVAPTDAPILVEVLRQTTAGTMTSLTPALIEDGITYTILATAQHTATVEPTAGTVLWHDYVHPQFGIWLPGSLLKDPSIAPGNYLGIRVTAGVSVSCAPKLILEE